MRSVQPTTLTAAQISAFGSAPSGTDDAVPVLDGYETIIWHLQGATAGIFHSYSNGAWYAGRAWTSGDGEILAQQATGQYIQVEITAGTLTAGTWEVHKTSGRR